MTTDQIACMEETINNIQSRRDEAARNAEIDNYYGNPDLARRWQQKVNEEDDRLDGIKIALSILGYNLGWKDGKRIIV